MSLDFPSCQAFLLIPMKRTMTAQILSEIILTDKPMTNERKTKGKRYFKKLKKYKSLS